MRPGRVGSFAFLAASLAVLGVTVPATPVAAQGQGCEWLPGTRNVTSRAVGSNRVTYASTPRLRCQDGRYIQADSAIQFEASRYIEFIGRVVFREDGRELRSDRSMYFEGLGRLDAEGNVVLTQPDGNEIRGERLTYLRAGPQRPREELTVTGGRPTAYLYPSPAAPDTGAAEAPAADTLAAGVVAPDTLAADTLAADTVAAVAEPAPVATDTAPPVPYEIEADRIVLPAGNRFTARGNVEVRRDSLDARSDSLDYDGDLGELTLVGRPARLVQGQLDLTGRTVRLRLPGDVIEQVEAIEDGRLLTDSLEVDAPRIVLFLADELLQRMVASAPRDSAPALPVARGRTPAGNQPAADEPPVDSLPRAVVTGQGIVMRADSVDLLSPGQRLERMTAVGTARAVSTSRDSLNAPDTPELLRNDWLEGDTVIAVFIERVEAVEGVDRSEYVLETLESRRNARSLYRLDPDSSQLADTTAFRGRLPATYAEAEGILLTFEDGRVVRFRYDGLQRGQQLQPVRLPGEAPPPRPTGGGGAPEPASRTPSNEESHE